MATTIKLRRGTSSEWTSQNPILNEGEVGIETNTGKYKIGNGSTRWLQLDYFLSETVINDAIANEVSEQIATLENETPSLNDIFQNGLL